MNRSTVALLFVGLAAFASTPPGAHDRDMAVVVNSNNPVSGLGLGEVRKIFAGEKRTWPGGLPIRLITRVKGTHERIVLLKILDMSEVEYKQYWTTQVFRGEAATEPVAVFSNGMAKEAVVSIPGAIALMEARDVKPGIKVLKVDGRLPGSPGYPLE
jgi:phosphate transport system substrate-binding protein